MSRGSDSAVLGPAGDLFARRHVLGNSVGQTASETSIIEACRGRSRAPSGRRSLGSLKATCFTAASFRSARCRFFLKCKVPELEATSWYSPPASQLPPHRVGTLQVDRSAWIMEYKRSLVADPPSPRLGHAISALLKGAILATATPGGGLKRDEEACQRDEPGYGHARAPRAPTIPAQPDYPQGRKYTHARTRHGGGAIWTEGKTPLASVVYGAG